MSVALLDVNVLVALFDPAHVNHEEAHRWFGTYRKRGWATCPITINGCVRVLSSPAYPSFSAPVSEVVIRLKALCSSQDHQFWADEISLIDDGIIRPGGMGEHQKITDVYLLALAVHKQGTLVSFDRSIPLRAVVGAERAHLRLLGSAVPVPED